MSDSSTIILEGIDDVINSHLFVERRFTPDYTYCQRRSCNELSEAAPMSFNGAKFVADMYQCIEANLDKRPVNRTPSSENWKLRSTKDHDMRRPSVNNKSVEVKLERAIVEEWPNSWNYQMPIASGLFDEHSDKRRAVDLVFDHQDEHYDLVELKVNMKAGSPLYAAMEILCYGLVYMASRSDRAGNLKYNTTDLPVLRANSITLCVLAPESYFKGSQLMWLQCAINEGLERLTPSDLKMDFCFKKFGGTWCDDLPQIHLPGVLVLEAVWQ